MQTFTNKHNSFSFFTPERWFFVLFGIKKIKIQINLYFGVFWNFLFLEIGTIKNKL